MLSRTDSQIILKRFLDSFAIRSLTTSELQEWRGGCWDKDAYISFCLRHRNLAICRRGCLPASNKHICRFVWSQAEMEQHFGPEYTCFSTTVYLRRCQMPITPLTTILLKNPSSWGIVCRYNHHQGVGHSDAIFRTKSHWSWASWHDQWGQLFSHTDIMLNEDCPVLLAGQMQGRLKVNASALDLKFIKAFSKCNINRWSINSVRSKRTSSSDDWPRWGIVQSSHNWFLHIIIVSVNNLLTSSRPTRPHPENTVYIHSVVFWMCR